MNASVPLPGDRIRFAIEKACIAANHELEQAGPAFDSYAVVVNVAVARSGQEFAFGSKVPDDAPALLAASLRESAAEVKAAEQEGI